MIGRHHAVGGIGSGGCGAGGMGSGGAGGVGLGGTGCGWPGWPGVGMIAIKRSFLSFSNVIGLNKLQLRKRW
jgi:hypothetical protein